MSTSVIEPGTRLAGRYRLEERVTETAGSTLWKAMDETLARLVSVRTFAPGFPRVHEVVTAARAASRLTDPRLTQVFDAEDNAERAYVVSEWTSGESLQQLLSSGPLDPGRAATLVLEAAEALAAAHGAGLAHLWLTPADLLWTTGGTVKVTGLGVISALSGRGSEDPARADTHGLGKLLYAGLTAHWPGPEDTGLPQAPWCGEHHCSPRQVRSEIPPLIDEITRRALPPTAEPAPAAFTGPAELAAALKSVPRTPAHLVGLPAKKQPRARPATGRVPPPPPVRGGDTTQVGTGPGQDSRQYGQYGQYGHGPAGRPINRTLVSVGVVVVLLALVIGGWQLFRDPESGGSATPPASRQPRPEPELTQLSVAAASGFDPPPGDGEEHNEEAAKAIDGKPASRWNTEEYNSPKLGGLKKGVGLLLDMGRPVRVGAVKVTTPPPAGGRVELRVGDQPTLGALNRAAPARQTTGGTIQFRPDQAVQGQYVLVWFTELPSELPSAGEARGQVGDVVVYGAK